MSSVRHEVVLFMALAYFLKFAMTFPAVSGGRSG
jgi:hypothetical protein